MSSRYCFSLHSCGCSAPVSSSSGLAAVITQGFAALLCGLDGDNLFLIWCVDVSDLLLIPMYCL